MMGSLFIDVVIDAFKKKSFCVSIVESRGEEVSLF